MKYIKKNASVFTPFTEIIKRMGPSSGIKRWEYGAGSFRFISFAYSPRFVTIAGSANYKYKGLVVTKSFRDEVLRQHYLAYRYDMHFLLIRGFALQQIIGVQQLIGKKILLQHLSYSTFTNEEKRRVKEIIECIKDTENFKTAFTHKSCCNKENKLKSYETLEFLGDSILDFYTCLFLYTCFPNYHEGGLTKLKDSIIKGENIGSLAKEIGLYEYLKGDKGFEKLHQKDEISKESKNILADIFESFVAALYLEKGEKTLQEFLSLTIFNNPETKNKLKKYKFASKENSLFNGKRMYSTYNKPIIDLKPSTFVNKKSVILHDDSPVFKLLNEFLKTNPINNETQIKLEEFLIKQWEFIIESNISSTDKTFLDFNKISNGIINEIKYSIDNLEKLLNNFKFDNVNLKYKKSMKQYDKVSFYLYKIMENVDNKTIIGLMLGRLLGVVSSFNKLDFKTECTKVYYSLGIELINIYIYNLYKAENSDFTLSEWKSINKDKFDILESDKDAIIVLLGFRLIQWLIEVELIETDIIYRYSLDNKLEQVSILKVTSKLQKLIGKNPLLNLPFKLPMIVKPKVWKKELINGKYSLKYGGYLLNDVKFVEDLIIKKWSLKNQSEILDCNLIINSINNLNSVSYVINEDVLDFILNKENNNKYNFIIDQDNVHPLVNVKKKLTKTQQKELDSFNSSKELELNIINIALVYKNIPEFYIPVRIDNRGRIYCSVDYLNYQSIELAKSLLLFSKAEKLYKYDSENINYFKVYGANCFGNKIEKYSFEDRINWVNKNQDDIINFKNGKLLEQAENKCLFLAFCFEYKRFIECLNNSNISYFETRLPIQLDASCNGYQHLSLLTRDNNLIKELNLVRSNSSDIPKDFYSYLALRLKDYLKECLNNNLTIKSKEELSEEDRKSYTKLYNISIQRSMIKKPIMTTIYNVSYYSLIQYMKDSFKYENEKYVNINDPSIVLEKIDFDNLGKGFIYILYRDFPKLERLNKYLKDVAKICTKLNIYIPWILPSGLFVKQSYLEIKEVRLKPFAFKKNRVTINITNKNKFDSTKQMTAFMPNLIHSLDSASLAMFIDLFYKDSNEKKNFFAIHDCFATTAPNITNLISLLKLVYINIYSKDNYLIKLDNNIIQHIKNLYGEKCFNENTRTFTMDTNVQYKLPDIAWVLGETLDFDSLNQSKYIIH